jgi:endo-1,4-beta-mannosidase
MPPKLRVAGNPVFLLGVNYWSRAGGPRMWERFDESRVRAELAQMRAIGLNTCRCFAFIPSFMPQPGQIEPQMLKRLDRFFELCQQQHLWTIPTALVGHMSGENYDFAGQAERCLFSDPELLEWQGAMVASIAEIGRSHAAVAAYLASNEMPLWAGRNRPDLVAEWARHLRGVLDQHDSQRPFGLGDGAMNLKGGQTGFDPLVLRPHVDLVGPHTYYSDSDPLRQAANAEYCLRSLSYLDLPVVFEEFGCSANQASEEHQADYYRMVIHASLSSGASGALGWCFSDFDLVDAAPYRHHAFELGFGITRADGSEKVVCNELRAISQLIERLDYPSLTAPTPEAAIIVPRYFNETFPFSWEERDRMRRVLLQSYALCLKAGIEAELVPEEADLRRYALLLAPATQKLLAPTWRTLLEQARRGQTLYWSYYSGDHTFHQGVWCQNFAELTGCRHDLRYACYDLPPPELSLQGNGLSIDIRTHVGQQPHRRAFLPIGGIAGDSTEIIARGEPGNAVALTSRRHGTGQVFFCAFPLEYYLAEQAEVNESDRSEQLYRMLAARAGIERKAQADAPFVQTRTARDKDGTLLWLLNHAWSTQVTQLDSPAGTAIYGTNESLQEGRHSLELGPKQVQVYRLAEPD